MFSLRPSVTIPARAYTQHVPIPSTCLYPARAYTQHVSIPSTYLYPARAYTQHVPIPSTCLYPTRVYTQHVSISSTCLYPTEIPAQNSSPPFQVFPANSDRNTPVTHVLYPHPRGRYVRIVVQAWHKHISLRAELYGCKQVWTYFEDYQQNNMSQRCVTGWTSVSPVIQSYMLYQQSVIRNRGRKTIPLYWDFQALLNPFSWFKALGAHVEIILSAS